MSMENAKEFLKKITKDEALNDRVTGKEPDEVLAVAKELGLECTKEELEKAAKNRELDLDEMAEAAGGDQYVEMGKMLAGGPGAPAKCTNPSGHQWIYTHHEEEAAHFLWVEVGTRGYNYFGCPYCHQVMRKRIRQSDY